MANKKEVRQHIESVSDIGMITNAMYLIASTKLRRAKESLSNARPYFNALKQTMHALSADKQAQKSSYFRTEGDKNAFVVITGDKGLAGAYNYNVIRSVLPLLENNEKALLFPIGAYGKQYFIKHGYNVKEDFSFSSERGVLHSARIIGGILTDMYDRNEINEIFIVYTDFSGGMDSTVKIRKLLPFEGEEQDDLPREFYPSAQEVMKNVVPEYVIGYLYGAMTDGFCSEQNARMTAMDAANKNAEKLLEELSVKYDHIRQNSITQEIIEVSAGTARQRNKGEIG